MNKKGYHKTGGLLDIGDRIKTHTILYQKSCFGDSLFLQFIILFLTHNDIFEIPFQKTLL